jgi:putative ABC transport system ATP-binding protein
MSLLIEADGITKKYNQYSNHTELLPTSLKIHKGMIYVIKGKSGAGKSTLLNILGGMDRPTSGKVFIHNRSFYDLSDHEQSKIRSRTFGFIFQSYNLIPELTAFENIELPKHFNRELKIDSSSIKNLSEELGIAHLLNKRIYQLSGGEQQRVGIARALITNPDIVFADEPTGNLDAMNSQIIVNLISKHVILRRTTLVMVTHEEGLIKENHKELTIHNGKLKVVDSIEQHILPVVETNVL